MDYDDDTPDYREVSDQKRKARVRHRCMECGGIIEPGETYRVVKYVADDPGIKTYKAHVDYAVCRKVHIQTEAEEQSALEEYQKALEAHLAEQ